MAYTKYDNLIARGASIPVRTTFPQTPEAYYGVNVGENDAIDWSGGEMFYYSTDQRIYMNSATSGRTATWRRLADALDTSTTSTTTSTSTTTTSTTTTTTTSTSSTTTSTTSSTTSTSSSTSTTSSTTSTSSSTSSTTSTSTSTSSTTTA